MLRKGVLALGVVLSIGALSAPVVAAG